MTKRELQELGYVPYAELVRLRRRCALAWAVVIGMAIGWLIR